MKTTKPIATISFNTLAYLALRLEELRKARKISFWCLISHKGEDDESGKKPHMHLYIEPACSVQTDDICDFLVEPVPGSDKPFRCLPFRSSKFADWYLYALHAREYLQAKGLRKVYHYSDSDFVSSDADYLRSLVYGIDWLQVAPARAVVDAVNSGLSREDFLLSGRVPITQVGSYLKLFEAASAKKWEAVSEKKVLEESGFVPGEKASELNGVVVDEDGVIVGGAGDA